MRSYPTPRLAASQAQIIDGSGLGLAIADPAVQAAACNIEMLNAPDTGTILRLRC